MIDVLYALVLILSGFVFGYFFTKYRKYEDELSYDLSVIKEDITSIYVKLESMTKDRGG